MEEMNKNPSYEELKRIYNNNFTLSYLGPSTNKLALISLTCHIFNILKAKKPDLTIWELLYKLNKQAGEPVPDKDLKGISIVCEDFNYGGPHDFPTFGLQDKEIPNKIKEILGNWLPF